MDKSSNDTVILGGGLAGLSAGYVLTQAGERVKIFESGSTVGGLSRTVVKEGFRFDLGGHRFFTKDERIDTFVRRLMEEELISVSRTSKIYMRNKFFDYPLKPLNAIFGLGVPTTLRILGDYAAEKVLGLAKKTEAVSLEDWVVRNFGRTMFNIYFRDYSEKVWGIECSNISAEWVAQRIKGLSLAKAVKNAFFKFSGKDIPTLADRFIYPQLGIGRLSDRLREEIERSSKVFTDTTVVRINHGGGRIGSVAVKNHRHNAEAGGKDFISSLPLPGVVRMLYPAPPREVLDAASRLRFRDLVVVAVMVDRERVTDETWIYIQERCIPFGRIHEPTNWSRKMAPEGKTLIVMEFFSFKDDEVWSLDDESLVDVTVAHLEKLGFIGKREVLDSAVVRVPKAYPLFDVGYRKHCEVISAYLGRFENLHVAGRGGMFRYYNMDHAIESGINVAERLLRGDTGAGLEAGPEMALSGR
jgi:protoporphyrinogen oxidase